MWSRCSCRQGVITCHIRTPGPVPREYCPAFLDRPVNTEPTRWSESTDPNAGWGDVRFECAGCSEKCRVVVKNGRGEVWNWLYTPVHCWTERRHAAFWRDWSDRNVKGECTPR